VYLLTSYNFIVYSRGYNSNKYITSKGFYYTKDLITNFYLSLKTKPFVIRLGISATGKSKIVKLFVQAVGANSNIKDFN